MPKKVNPFQKTAGNLKKQFRDYFSDEQLRILKVVGLATITIALMVVVYFGEQAGMWFKASVLEAPQPFNGTVMPIAKVPKWTHWHTQNNATFDKIPESDLIDFPAYDLEKLTFPNDQLVWGDSSQDDIRNAKLTYPVVYLGNYKLDHQEAVGSHLAVDIKLPVGTPIHSIANGKVVKMSMQATGFGHHIVIKHPNVPDPQNPGKLTTLYSAFSHMDRIDVVEGQNVLKGQIIGTSGNSGTSTTPHLHFQIDTQSAPWHPYWPFSWAEAQDAGLSFFEAVNAGLGITKARIHTVNPMKFVTANIGSFSVASATDISVENPVENPIIDPVEDPVEKPIDDPVEVAIENPVIVEPEEEVEVIENPFNDISTASLFNYKIIGESVSLINNGVTLTVIDENEQLRKLNEGDPVDVELTGVGQLLKKRFRRADFVNNAIKVIVKSAEPGTATVTVGKSSHQISFIGKATSIGKFYIDHDGHYQKNVVETVKIIALDDSGNLTPTPNFSGIVDITIVDGFARIIPSQLDKQDFDNGIATIKVIVSNEDPLILRAQNGALVGQSAPLISEQTVVFNDINRSHPNYTAIKFLKDNDIISGYSDGTFRPNQTVNRVEALKMLMLAFNTQAGAAAEINFTDVDSSAWYASTLSTAVGRGIVKGYGDGSFRPGSLVNRAEYLKMLFSTNNFSLDPISIKPYEDVEADAWFAPFAFMANKMNLLVAADYFNPSGVMTRAGVAETIYRMRVIQDNNLVSYSK